MEKSRQDSIGIKIVDNSKPLNDFEQRIQERWEKFTDNSVKKWYKSSPNRIITDIEWKLGASKY